VPIPIALFTGSFPDFDYTVPNNEDTNVNITWYNLVDTIGITTLGGTNQLIFPSGTYVIETNLSVTSTQDNCSIILKNVFGSGLFFEQFLINLNPIFATLRSGSSVFQTTGVTLGMFFKNTSGTSATMSVLNSGFVGPGSDINAFLLKITKIA
jgi:hypothetical protein